MEVKYKLVPVEPTPEMEATFKDWMGMEGDFRQGYDGLLYAAPLPPPSDLEIVKKALEKTRASLSVNNGDFIVEEFESCGGNTVAVIDSAIFENAESLLTWAKQTIGGE